MVYFGNILNFEYNTVNPRLLQIFFNRNQNLNIKIVIKFKNF